MKTTGLFTVTEFSWTSPRESDTVKLIPFGDVHRESDNFSCDYWERFLSYGKSQKNAIFLGMGDYTDAISTSERQVISRGLHDTTTKNLEAESKASVRRLGKELAFMRNRIIGLIGGNHYFDYRNGTTSDHYLAEVMDCRYLGVASIIRLNLTFAHARFAVDIFAHHGKGGGGATPGATYNTLEKMLSAVDADIYLQGHDHRRGVISSTPRMRIMRHQSKLIVRERTPWLGRTGSFLKAYEPGAASYIVDVLGSPASLGWIEFDISMTRSGRGVGCTRTINIKGIS